ncbi:MAG: rod shape-determining protein MreD [Candidatus Moraniibacteriota bacterium]
MTDKIIIFFVIFCVAILQVAVFSNLLFLGIGPNALLILIIFWTIHEGFEEALPKIVLAGLISDLVSFYPVGLSVISFSLVAFLGNSFSKRFLVTTRNWRLATSILLIIVSTLINGACLFGFFELFKYFRSGEANDIIFSKNVIMFTKGMLLNVLFFFLISFPLMKVEQFLNLRKNKKNLNYA